MKDIIKMWAILPHVALIMLAPILSCILIGHFLDSLFGTDIVFLIIFIFLGVGAAFRSMYMFCMEYAKKEEKENKKNKKKYDMKKITGKR